MMPVLKPGCIGLCVFMLLAGCSTEFRRPQTTVVSHGGAAARPKSVPTEVERVDEAPRLAPPPAPLTVAPGPDTNRLEETWISLDDWARRRGLGPLRDTAETAFPSFQLATTNHLLVIRANNPVAEWDGVEFLLAFAPQMVNGRLLVHPLDLKKNIEPLLERSLPPLRADPVIVIDPGHGGQYPGTSSVLDGAPEKQFTLDWARRLASLLATNGWQVLLTRTNDVDVPLAERVAFAQRHQADLFISLHFNSAAPNEEQSGVETYCLTPTGLPSTLTRGYEDDVSLSFTNNAFDTENLLYAFQVQRLLLPVVGKDRGVRHARFLGVLRGQNRPAVLIEGGYLSNPDEARHIADPAYRQKLAEAVAAALAPEPEPAVHDSEMVSWKPPVESTNSEILSSNSTVASPQLH
jgi:N-acetylmuramoyl-L-alanine amidase